MLERVRRCTLAAMLVAGCGSRSIQMGDFPCTTDNDCPWGLVCQDQHCGGGSAADSRPPDTRPSAPDTWTPPHDTCAQAPLLSFATSQDTLTTTGTTSGAVDDVLLAVSDCTGSATAAPDVFYRMTLEQAYGYRFELVPTGFEAALYVFSSCGDVAATCGSGMGSDGDSAPPSYVTEYAVVAPAATGTFYIGVDGRTSTDTGEFTLKVTRVARAANDTCEQAELLDLQGGYATDTDDLALDANDATIPATSGCFTPIRRSSLFDTVGPDLFYKVELEAQKTYRISAQPTPQTYKWLTLTACVLTGCADPVGTCQAGTQGVSGYRAEFPFTPTATGPYVIAVDTTRTPTTPRDLSFKLEVQLLP